MDTNQTAVNVIVPREVICFNGSMRHLPREGAKHPAREEALLVKQYQDLRAAGDFGAADKILEDLLIRFRDKAESLAAFLVEESNWEWQDAFQNARAVLSELFEQYFPEGGIADSQKGVGKWLFLTLVPTKVGSYRERGQWRGRRIGGRGHDRGAELKTNRMRALLSVVDTRATKETTEDDINPTAARLAYLVLRLPNEVYRFIVFRRLGFTGQGEATLESLAEELKVTHQNVQAAEQRAYEKLRKYYVPFLEGEEEITPDELERFEDVIVTRLVNTLQAIQDKEVSGVMWRYYDLDGRGRLTGQELSDQYQKPLNWSFTKMSQGRAMVADAIALDREAQEALRRLGLSKIDPADLLFSFGEELRAKLKPQAV